MSHIDLHELLKKYWGYDSFRPPQEAIIQHIMDRKDSVVLLPTGGGKSLCYQLPALALEGTTLVISPLISLMQDQITQLHERNISAALLHSGQHSSEKKKILDNVAKGKYDLLYMAPERLELAHMMDYLRSAKLNLVAIDEAHCISQWGHDFRPSYLKVGIVREIFPDIPVIALTGTATSEVLEDITTILDLPEPRVFRSGFERPNIELTVLQEDNKLAYAVHLLKQSGGTSIVYVRSRRTSVELAGWLYQRGIVAGSYHAGMPSSDREEVQKKWLKNKVGTIVATSAFGMGVDKPDVRCVIHFELPPSIEDYYQEIGRAGRDGKPSMAVLLYNQRDVKNLIKRQVRQHVSRSDIQDIYKRLCNYLGVSAEASSHSFAPFEPAAFADHFGLDRETLRKSLMWLQEREYLEFRSGQILQSRVMFKKGKAGMEAYMSQKPSDRNLIQTMLRAYEGLFSVPAPVNEVDLARLADMDAEEVVRRLDAMAQMGMIVYEKATLGKAVRISGVREWSERLDLDYQRFLHNESRKRERAKAVLEYLGTDSCRAKWLLAYFDEVKEENCGHCDICLGVNDQQVDLSTKKEYIDKIYQLLEDRPLLLPEIIKAFPVVDKKAVIAIVEEMVEEGDVVVKDATFTLPSNAT